MSWQYAPRQEDAESIRIINRALDEGITLLDTADAYGPYKNEEIIGRAIAHRRHDAIISTKCGIVVEDASTFRVRKNGRPEHIRSACEASLRRLGVDAIDIYTLHRPDPDVPLEETVGAMAKLVTAGKVRCLAVSELDVDQLERAISVHPIALLQSELSLWTGDVLRETLPWCENHRLGFIAYAPLGRGFLTGRYRSRSAFAEGDYRLSQSPRFASDAIVANLPIADRIGSIAASIGATPAQVALAWILAKSNITVPIPGADRMEFLEEDVKAADLQISAEILKELDDLPAPAGARYTDATSDPTETAVLESKWRLNVE